MPEQSYKDAAIAQNALIHDTLAQALGYPEFKPGEPGYSSDKVNYDTGDHTAETLAVQAARRLESAQKLTLDATSIAVEIAECRAKKKPAVFFECDYGDMDSEDRETSLLIAIASNQTQVPTDQISHTYAHAVCGSGVNQGVVGMNCVVVRSEESTPAPGGDSANTASTLVNAIITVQLPKTQPGEEVKIPVGEIEKTYLSAVRHEASELSDLPHEIIIIVLDEDLEAAENGN